jgi:predicted O-linked N-acetylglucosamine transferase (SPINDLY family)
MADPVLIPAEHRGFYTEKIAYLPDSYQVNDRSRSIAVIEDARKDHGLPEQGFVFCCFNNNWKITPDLFDVWMRLLKRVEGSVLWLFQENQIAADNLTKEAELRGVASSRLVFAEKLPLDQHLARHRHANLFLDTCYYNAHTTASDALWAGLPVLTIQGNTFASRVAASLLNAIDLAELIAHSVDEYEALAVELVVNPAKLNALKKKLASNRLTTPLFDTPRFTRHLENSYEQMVARHRQGLQPDHIYVPVIE